MFLNFCYDSCVYKCLGSSLSWKKKDSHSFLPSINNTLLKGFLRETRFQDRGRGEGEMLEQAVRF